MVDRSRRGARTGSSGHRDRRARIIELVAEHGYVPVSSLAALTGVSSVTVRRDLSLLADEGLITRIHGAAATPTSMVSFGERAGMALPQKRAIGRAAAALVADGETVMIDAGTTALEVARHLASRPALSVITNSDRVVHALALNRGIVTYLTGGRFTPDELSLVGSAAEAMLRDRRAGIAFIASGGFVPGDGATDADEDEVAVRRAMIASSARRYLVIDSDKFGIVLPILIAPTAMFSGVVTDDGLPAAARKEVRAAGLDLVVARPASPIVAVEQA